MMRCDECDAVIFGAGDIVPAGVYLRVDDGSFRRVVMEREGPLPATLDGHVGEYRTASTICGCQMRARASVLAESNVITQ